MTTSQDRSDRVAVAGRGVRRRAAADNPCRVDDAGEAQAMRPRRWIEDPQGWIDDYSPQSLPAGQWDDALAGFVRGCLHRLVAGGHGSLPRLAPALSQLAAWSRERGTPLDVELVLDPTNVEQFTDSLRRGSSRGDYRAALRRAGRALTRTAPWDDAPAAVTQRQVAAPYSADDVARLEVDAANQHTAERRQAFAAFLALGLGAGLDGRWAGQVRARDVREIDGRVVIEVGEPAPRLVPVRERHAAQLLAIAADAGEGLLITGEPTRNRVNHVRRQLTVSERSPGLDLGRLRATWIVAQLEARTQVTALVAAAGVAGLTTFSDLLEFVDRPARREAWAQLEGA